MRTALPLVSVAVLAFFAFAPLQPAWSGPNCKKGIPCGNSCIAANKTCRIGASGPSPSSSVASTSAAAAAPVTAPAAPKPAAEPSPEWVGSIADSVYFLASCAVAKDLARGNRRHFESEQEAQAAGFRRSSVAGC
jgi:hypothetical protein